MYLFLLQDNAVGGQPGGGDERVVAGHAARAPLAPHLLASAADAHARTGNFCIDLKMFLVWL